MKLGVVGPLPPLRGGISQYNASLIKSLRKAGHTVMAVSFKRLYPGFLFPGTSERDESVPPFPDAHHLLEAWNPLTWKKASGLFASSGVERLIAHHWHPFFAPCLGGVCRGQKVVIIAHNVLPHEHRAVGVFLNRFLFRKAAMVIVGAEGERKVLRKMLPGVGSEVVPHPVYDHFSEGKEDRLPQAEAKLSLGHDPEKPLFVHVGLVRKYKGADILLEAFAKLKNREAFLEIAGEFYDDFSGYRQLTRRLHLEGRVRLLDKYLTKEELRLRLFAADAVVLPYRHATQSGVAMAALACGAPVIASATGSLTEVIEEGVFGWLVPPGDPEALAAALDHFLERDPVKMAEMREKIAPLARERFGWKHLVDTVTGTLP